MLVSRTCPVESEGPVPLEQAGIHRGMGAGLLDSPMGAVLGGGGATCLVGKNRDFS